jgi:uncharacterized ubiquitin-like protein YukD
MNIVTVKLANLKPLEKNVRMHPESQIKELMRSVEQFGQTRPMVIDEKNNILVGNGLHKALVTMGRTEGDALLVTGLTEIQKKKLILTDNKTYDLGMDDYANIESFIKEVTDFGDFDIAGFDEESLKLITITEKDAQESDSKYGVLTEKAKENVEKAEVRDEKYVTGTPASTPTWEKDTPVDTPVTPTEKQRKFVLCPRCGEVIYLD